MIQTYRSGLIALALLGAAVIPAAAQVERWDPTGLQLTRGELEQMLTRFDETAGSSAYSGALREQAEREAGLIRARLTEGDMRVGDRVLLAVEGHPQLSDTFNVVAGRMIVLPEVGQVPLQGVLRSELQSHLTSQIARFIRDPIVQVRALIRLEILGAVASPGFYPVPSDLLLTDVLMLAGGPAANAVIERVEIRRGQETIWQSDRVRQAMIEGRTLDQMSVRAGDGIFVPTKTSRFSAVRDVFLFVSGIVSLALLAAQADIF